MEWWFFLWAVDISPYRSRCAPRSNSHYQGRSFFCCTGCLFTKYYSSASGLIFCWRKILIGKYVKISLPPFCGGTSISKMFILSVSPPPNDLPRTTLAAEKFSVRHRTLLRFKPWDSFFHVLFYLFFLGGAGGWNIENTWNLEFLSFLFLGRFSGPLHNLAQKWLKRTPAGCQQMPF